MKEKLYTIPVNDAFHKNGECPICEMYQSLEQAAIEFVMGPSYMEDDVRMETDEIGFCNKHVKQLYQHQNRLGLSLMLLTHMDRTIQEMKQRGTTNKNAGGLFKKKEKQDEVAGYLHHLKDSCYLCNRIERMMNRYLITVFYLYQKEPSFRESFRESKGFCLEHYALLRENAEKHLRSGEREEFIQSLDKIVLENLTRVRDDLEWFTDKFDYRYVNEPWKNAKDALPRSIQKLYSEYQLEGK